ncbi:MAG: beta-ketoacyl synthase N-terminal-like domain-containing protein, partial [Terriglobales bacterium]
MESVVITGMAVLAASGTETAQFWENLQAGRSSLVPLTRVKSDKLT